jgi:protease-4
LRKHERLQLNQIRSDGALRWGVWGASGSAECFGGNARNAPRSCAWLLALLAALSAGCIHIELFGGAPSPLEERVILGETGPKILMLPIDGVISMEATPGSGLLGREQENSVSRVREALDKAREDDEIRALLLRIDSPGGTATASDVIHSEILRFKQERGVPVVAHLLGTAASGGYYVAMAADRVVAHPTTVTGSIGVIFVGVNLAGLMQKLGVEDQTLVSGPYKDAGSMLRRMRPAERAQLQSILDELHAHFRDVVVAGRPGLDAAGVARLADGRVFAAHQALEAGLVDEIGDLPRAVAVASERAGIETARVVTYHRPSEHANNLFTRTPIPERIEIAWPAPFEWLTHPGFYYLWTPGIP